MVAAAITSIKTAILFISLSRIYFTTFPKLSGALKIIRNVLGPLKIIRNDLGALKTIRNVLGALKIIWNGL